MSCDFAHFDGSYVLGSLSPTDRQEFEQHLDDCAGCAQSVRELAGLPGLLARVHPDVLDLPSDPVPETLLPGLVREVRRTHRRRTRVAAGLAAAVVVTIAAGTAAVVNDEEGPASPPSASASAGVSMTPVQQSQVTARVALETVPWGTRLTMTCSYAGRDEYATPAPTGYAMFVHTRDGDTEQVATWKPLPGRTMTLAAATAAQRKDITSVEVRTTEGTTVLTSAGI
jgi:hypothetical protein